MDTVCETKNVRSNWDVKNFKENCVERTMRKPGCVVPLPLQIQAKSLNSRCGVRFGHQSIRYRFGVNCFLREKNARRMLRGWQKQVHRDESINSVSTCRECVCVCWQPMCAWIMFISSHVPNQLPYFVTFSCPDPRNHGAKFGATTRNERNEEITRRIWCARCPNEANAFVRTMMALSVYGFHLMSIMKKSFLLNYFMFIWFDCCGRRWVRTGRNAERAYSVWSTDTSQCTHNVLACCCVGRSA